MGEGIYHAPQFLPFYPTAGVLWPRVVEIECDQVDGRFLCSGYHWLPGMGRGEYLFVRPVLREPSSAPTEQVIREVIREVPGPERIILREVEIKPKRQ